MTGALIAGVLAAAGVISWLHLKRSSRGAAKPFPSLQLISGMSPRRRPEPRIEEPVRWLLRTAALVSAAAALLAARSDDPRRGLAILVDPAGGPAGLALGRAILSRSPASAHAVLFSFDNGSVVAESRPAESDRLAAGQRKLSACGAPEVECLWRAASDPTSVLVISPFQSAAWMAAIRILPRTFFYRRIPPAPAGAGPAVTPEPPRLPACRVERGDDSRESRIWEAALLAVTGRTDREGCALRVGLPSVAMKNTGAGPARLFVAIAPAGATAEIPEVAATRSPALAVPDDLAPVAGRRALSLDASLAFRSDPRFEHFLAPVLARRIGPGNPVLAVAGSAEDLGRWANDGSLLSLARLIVFEAGVAGPFPARTAPPPTRLGWTDEATGSASAVGILDAPPGRYLRDDRRVTFDRRRDPDAPTSPLPDSELASLGGRNELPSHGPGGRAILIFVLLGLAVLFRLADVAGPRVVPAGIAYLAVAGILVLWIFDPAVPARGRPRLSARAAGRFTPAERAGLRKALEGADIELDSESTLSSASIAIAGRESRVPVDALLFPASVPRLDLLSVEIPDEVRVGEAANLRLIVEARRAAGRTLRARATADSGAGSEASVRIGGDFAVVPISLTVTPASAGVGLGSVEVRFADAPGADPDGAVLPIVARAGRRKFLVASTSPNWDARAAAEALGAAGIDVAFVTALGKNAALGRGAAPEDPSVGLARAGALDGVDAVVLAGTEPLGAAARASLDGFVRHGGGLLLLGPVPGVPGLTASGPASEDSSSQSATPVVGSWGDRHLEFEGFVPPDTELAAGAQVLARLGPRDRGTQRPWIGGRGFGRGRIVEVLVPDLWRLGGPGSSQAEASASLIREIAAWLLAGNRPPTRIRISDDLSSFLVERDGIRSLVDPRDPGRIDGLPVEAREPLSAALAARASQRALALRRGRILVEADSTKELADIWRRLPHPDVPGRRVAARLDDRVAAIFLILFPLEVFLRRRIPVDPGSRGAPLPAAQS